MRRAPPRCAPPVVIDRVTPQVSGGAFAAKRIIGRPITVEADMFADGHDVVAAELLWKAADEKDWTRALAKLGQRPWRGAIRPKRIGRHLFTIEAGATNTRRLCHEIEVKHKAGVDIALEIDRGASLSRGCAFQGRRGNRSGVARGDQDARSRRRGGGRPSVDRARDNAPAASSKPSIAFVVQPPPISRRGRAAAGRVRELVRAVSALADRRSGAARHVRRRDRPPARRARRWASTSFISRRSIRSARPIARAATTR